MIRRLMLLWMLVLALLFVSVFAQTSAKKDAAGQDLSKEGAVIEQWTTSVVFQSDGTSTSEFRARVRIQTDAGVRQYGVLRFPYQAAVGRVEVHDVRITKPNGSVIATSLDSIQDMTSEVSREAPMYSDLREKHVPVKGLEAGDTLEYSARSLIEKPLATGQFWYGYQFIKSAVVLDEQLEISVPREREVKLKSHTIKPTTREENGRRIYTWKTSNLESVSAEEQKKVQSYDAMRGLLPPQDVLISSFRTWEEVGRWYDSLQQEKIQPSPEVKAKAEELTKALPDDDAKLHAIYNYVSLRYRYVEIAFGIGRYQPHAAAEILGNQYGDCKDKHTLLAALLNAVGIRAYPALINSQMAVDDDVPSPGQFNHVISVVAKGSTLSWMDTTPEVTAMGYLFPFLRGKPALVIMPDKVAFQTTTANSPFANEDTGTVTAKLDTDGTLHAHVEDTYRGDLAFYSRYLFRRWPEAQWKDLGEKVFYGARLGGTISNVRSSPLEKTEEPFTMAYDYTLRDFAGGDKHRFVVPISPFGNPEVKDEDLKRTTPLWLGYEGEYLKESRIELPKGWSATPPAPIDLKESFAEFQGSSEVHEGVLITKRRLLLKANAVTPDQLKSYKAFQKATSDDHNSYIFLHVSADVAAGTTAVPAQAMAKVEVKAPLPTAVTDFFALARETQQHVRDPGYFGLLWWVPVEYWEKVVEGSGMSVEKARERFAPLRKYTTIVVAVGTTGIANINWISEPELRANLKLRDAAGNDYEPLQEVSGDAKGLASIMKPMMANMGGAIGQNMQFYFFPASDKMANPIADALAPGSFSVVITNILGPKESIYEWKLPLTSLSPPRYCPVGKERMEASWKYCPWHGVKLDDTVAVPAPAAKK